MTVPSAAFQALHKLRACPALIGQIPLSALKSLHRLQGRVRGLTRIVRLRDAFQLIASAKRGEQLTVFLKPLNRDVVVRHGTSDLACLEKVFLAQEYKNPFAITPRLIVDAGANIGMASLFYAHEYPGATIIGIEPETSNFEILRANCLGIQNVTVLQAALWSRQCKLRIKDQNAEKWAMAVCEDPVSSAAADADVRAVTIPEILRLSGHDQIDILKLDIEGAEHELFGREAENWLGNVKQIAIELHDRYHPGCAESFYRAIISRSFIQEIRGENTFIRFIATDAA